MTKPYTHPYHHYDYTHSLDKPLDATHGVALGDRRADAHRMAESQSDEANLKE